MYRKALLSVAALLCTAVFTLAQDFGVKTNLLYDVTSTINIGIESRLSDRWTADFSGNYNAWPLKGGNTRKKHWLFQPELRYWSCESFSGHFVAVHALVGQYNFGGLKNNISFLGTDFSPLTDYRFQGWAAGGGIAYGYAWILGRHLNLEAEIGVGCIYTKYDQFNCVGCGKRVLTGQPHTYIGPTKAAVSLVYIF